jgi:hypothetical protein
MFRIFISRYREIFFGLFLYNLCLFRNQLLSLVIGDWTPILEFKQDAVLYVSQIQLGLKGESIYANPFWHGPLDESLVGRNYGLYLVGRLAGAVGLSLSVTFLVGVFLVSSLFFVTAYQLHSVYFQNNKVKLVLSLIFAIFIFGDFAYRPSPTQWALPILVYSILLFQKCYVRKDINCIVMISLGIVLALAILNPFYAVFAAISGLIFLLERFRSAHKIVYASVSTIVLTFLVGQIAEKEIIKNPSFQLIERWGLLFSHFPGALKNSSILITLILVNFYLFLQVTQKSQTKFTLLLCLSALITIQQNVVSGIWWEPESHYIYLVILCTYMTVLNILEILAKRSLEKGISKFVSLSLIALCLLLLVNNVNMSNNGIIKVNNYSQILEENSYVKQISEVLSDQTSATDLIMKPNSFASEVAWAGLLADRKFIWDYYGGYLSGSDSEILIRYMCNLRQDFFEISDIPKIELTQGHRFENANQHFGNWLFLGQYLNLLEDKSESLLLAREFNRISRILPFRGEERCKEFTNLRETKILTFGASGPMVNPYNANFARG